MLFPSRSPATTLISDSGDGGGLRRAPAGGSAPVPVINSVDLDNTSPTVGDTITATVSATGADSLAYQWLADGVPISGQTSSTYTTDRDNAMGHAITCQVTGTNGAGQSTPVTSDATAQVTGAVVNTVAPVVASTGADPTIVSQSSGDQASVGALAGSVGTWSGFPFPAFTYLWLNLNGSPTTDPVMPGLGDVGSNISCEVTGTNGIGAPVQVQSSNTISVGA